MTALVQQWRLPWRSLVVAAIAIVIAATPGGATAFALERELVGGGEWWRLLTGHLVHASSYHLWWNTLPLVALGLLWEPILGRRYWSLFGFSALVVGAGLVVLDPEMIGYVGLSGVLNGIWIAGALLAARQEASRWRWLYIGFVAADLCKIVFEAFSGLQIFTESSSLGARAVPLAHALGALAGVLWIGPGREENPRVLETSLNPGSGRRTLSPSAGRVRHEIRDSRSDHDRLLACRGACRGAVYGRRP